MKTPSHIKPHLLESMPMQTVQTVEDFVRDIVADQAIEGYICTAAEIAKLTEKVKRDHAVDISRFGGIVRRTLRSV